MVRRMEALGSRNGRTSQKIYIADCGEVGWGAAGPPASRCSVFRRCSEMAWLPHEVARHWMKAGSLSGLAGMLGCHVLLLNPR